MSNPLDINHTTILAALARKPRTAAQLVMGRTGLHASVRGRKLLVQLLCDGLVTRDTGTGIYRVTPAGLARLGRVPG